MTKDKQRFYERLCNECAIKYLEREIKSISFLSKFVIVWIIFTILLFLSSIPTTMDALYVTIGIVLILFIFLYALISLSKNYQKLIISIQKRKGVSPVIASILLIGLTVMVSAILFMVVLPFLAPSFSVNDIDASITNNTLMIVNKSQIDVKLVNVSYNNITYNLNIWIHSGSGSYVSFSNCSVIYFTIAISLDYYYYSYDLTTNKLNYSIIQYT